VLRHEGFSSPFIGCCVRGVRVLRVHGLGLNRKRNGLDLNRKQKGKKEMTGGVEEAHRDGTRS
jgi:hypothetical protein